MYETLHSDGIQKGIVTYTVWSDIFLCPFCNEDFVFWNEGLDFIKNEVKEKIECPHCSAKFDKNDCSKSIDTKFDPLIGKEINIAKQTPVLIKYNIGNKSFEKSPDKNDYEVIRKIESIDVPYWVPTDEIPLGFNTSQPIRSHGITHIHHFFTKRTLLILSFLYKELTKEELVLLTSMLNRASRTVKTLLSNYFSQERGKLLEDGPVHLLLAHFTFLQFQLRFRS
jgi:DNA-directed RNA polymerase subunit RPC12/RpoP